jgi:hypothetical protein
MVYGRIGPQFLLDFDMLEDLFPQYRSEQITIVAFYKISLFVKMPVKTSFFLISIVKKWQPGR